MHEGGASRSGIPSHDLRHDDHMVPGSRPARPPTFDPTRGRGEGHGATGGAEGVEADEGILPRI